MKWFGKSGPRRGDVLWGKYVIPHDLTTRHFMACGTTGSGKSALLRMLLRSVLPDVLVKEYDTRAIIYDAKSETYPDLANLVLGHETIVLNPFDSRCTAWDIGRDIEDAAQAKELAAVMVPQEQGQNRYFYDASRLLLEMAAVALMKLKGRDWSFRDLLLACANAGDLKALADQAALPNRIAIEDFLTAEREARSVRMTLTVENSAYHVIAAAWERARKAGKMFSIHDWVSGRGPQILLIGASKQSRTALATVNRLLIQRVQQLTLDYAERDEKSGRRTWVFLDEFPTLGNIPYLEELLTEGRSRGVCTVLGFQHIAHVQKWYRDTAEALLGQCLHQAYFRANDSTMARWSAQHFGRLITYDTSDGPPQMKVNDPAATENNFLDLDEATEKTGFECIIRSSRRVIPEGPKHIRIPPNPDLAAVDTKSTDREKARLVPWREPLRLDPWTAKEREQLGLPKTPVEADQIPLPVNGMPELPMGSVVWK